MNPYDFVRIDWERGAARRPPAPHDRFTDGLCGRIEGTITTLTPLFIPQSEDLRQKDRLFRSIEPKPIGFAKNTADQYVISGSSLKGLFRGLVETLGPGCWWLFDGEYKSRMGRKTIYTDYRDKLPSAFGQCPQQGGLCVACRLFGLISGDTGILLLGQVGFGDAVCDSPIEHDPLYTPIFDTPKPRHDAWYLDSSKKWVTGRKFYFHFTGVIEDTRLRPIPTGGFRNTYIHPIGPGSTFTFSAHFNNVAPDEWSVLLYALTLERTDWGHAHDVRHKIGYAKPAGLGSVEIQLTKLTLVDYRERYTSMNRGLTEYEGEALRDYVNDQIRQPFLDNTNSITLRDLRRIWKWPPMPGVTYRYPDWKWFKANPNAPISATP